MVFKLPTHICVTRPQWVKEILISSVLICTDDNFCKNSVRWKGKNMNMESIRLWSQTWQISAYNDGLVKKRRNSIANALELRLSWTNPSTWFSLLHIPLQIYEGTSISPTTGVREYCHQSALPQGDTVIIPGHIVTLVFITDNITSGTGFRLRYSSKSLCCFYAFVDEGMGLLLHQILFSTLKEPDYSPHVRKEHIKLIYTISRLLVTSLIR